MNDTQEIVQNLLGECDRLESEIAEREKFLDRLRYEIADKYPALPAPRFEVRALRERNHSLAVDTVRIHAERYGQVMMLPDTAYVGARDAREYLRMQVIHGAKKMAAMIEQEYVAAVMAAIEGKGKP